MLSGAARPAREGSRVSAFDPNQGAAAGSGIFGLPFAEEQAGLVIVPVPFAATVSYGGGAERGPAAICKASHQVDLYDLQFGRVYERGIHLRAADVEIESGNNSNKVEKNLMPTLYKILYF